MNAHRTLVIAADGCIECVGDALFELNLGSTGPEVVVAELELLFAGLADSVTFLHRSGRTKIKVARGDVVGRATAERRGESLALTVSETELGYWLSYFLRYYRDGAAEVDHLDVEASPSTPDGRGVDLRIRVARAAPPVSAEEARRRLGK